MHHAAKKDVYLVYGGSGIFQRRFPCRRLENREAGPVTPTRAPLVTGRGAGPSARSVL